ncbi:Dyp-type peroxidase [Gordonia crocea]|uniref:Putative peroxidase n=1 Tax=Gordonia crocea TaxID=589162 RepID=A0A7M3SV53_9ACTN|nr:Dyp-type peroxidase [Gordonia crocea]GED96527.1 putative peroxidase [Gordonia crocea]
MSDSTAPRSGLSRRRLLTGSAAVLGAAGVGAAAASAASRPDHHSPTVPFFGTHQAGVATAPQAHAQFLALDLRPGLGADEAMALLRLWTTDAARLTAGTPALADTEPELAHAPARLTVTVGFGPTFFDRVGRADRRPASVTPLPPLRIDRLEPRWSGGDLLLRVGSDDPVTLAHAVRVLGKNVRTLATLRWSQRGFRHAVGTHPSGQTMRNLMGHLDGTVNPAPGPDLDGLVWHDGTAQPWFAGGTTMVVRRIRMLLDTWDELDPDARDLTMGRRQDNGAPLTGTSEHDEPDFTRTREGIPIIPANAHIARAHARTPAERFLRQAYNYDDPPPPGRTSEAGLIFVAYQRDVVEQFLPVQRRLAEADALNTWTTPIGSAVFAIPPGVRSDDEYLGQTLFE